jgi:hypothetical protein
MESDIMTPHARQDKLLVQEVGDELVIYDRERDCIHSLNPATALVWRHCNGQTSIPELAVLLAEERGLPADEDVVWLALEQLQKVHLLRDGLPRTGEGIQASRREALRKLGVVGGLLLLPSISSIVAPTPAMAQYPDAAFCTAQCERARQECVEGCDGDNNCALACDESARDCFANCVLGP